MICSMSGNWSLPMDLLILARTIIAVFRSLGAYEPASTGPAPSGGVQVPIKPFRHDTRRRGQSDRRRCGRLAVIRPMRSRLADDSAGDTRRSIGGGPVRLGPVSSWRGGGG